MLENRRATPEGEARKSETSHEFDDLHPLLSDRQAGVEADRCLYCYDAPCITACPTSINIPTFIHQIRTGNIIGSAETILSQNIMGGTCARACPTEVLCERACVLNHAKQEPVEIGALQRYAVDHLLTHKKEHPFKRAPSTGKKIAVVGAGPAGLSCAHRAAMLGHAVTVFEAKEKAGGLNEYGLAAYKMVDDFAQKEIAFLLGIGGIEIKYQQKLGENLSFEALQRDFDAVFIAIGLGQANGLGLAGEELTGVDDAVKFIEKIRQTKDLSRLAIGRDVIVIGAGNTAIDAAIQAKKLGADTVTLVYRRGAQDMSATDWEIELARKNGVAIRLWAAPAALKGSDKLEAVRFERTELQEGKLVASGGYFELPADMLLKAIGQKLERAILEGFALEAGKLVVGADYQTSKKGIFAGGDAIASGEDLTVQAVEDGKQAAHAIDAYLKL